MTLTIGYTSRCEVLSHLSISRQPSFLTYMVATYNPYMVATYNPYMVATYNISGINKLELQHRMAKNAEVKCLY